MSKLNILKSNGVWTEPNGNKFFTVDKSDYEWLIEQAEMVEGLEKQADDMADKHAEKDIILNDLVRENKKLIAYIENSSIDSSDKDIQSIYEMSKAFKNHGRPIIKKEVKGLKNHQILGLIAETRRNNDYESFKVLLESLDVDQLLHLTQFARELESYCKRQLGATV